MTPYTRETAEAELAAAHAAGDSAAALLAAEDLDRMPPPPRPTLLGSALWYAENKLPVFPLTALSKVPWPGSRGVHDASTDPDQIRAWWQERPDSNIGLATGHRVDVIDFDGLLGHSSWSLRFCTPGTADGILLCDPCGYSWDVAWFGSFCRRCGQEGQPPPKLPDPGVRAVGTVSTPRPGGLHVYVPATGSGNKAKLYPGVDYRGIGGYVVAPPSQLDDREKQHPGFYEFLRPLQVEALA